MASEEVLLVDDREVVITDAMHVRCDGGNGALGHPMEFMTLEKAGRGHLQILRPPLRPRQPRGGGERSAAAAGRSPPDGYQLDAPLSSPASLPPATLNRRRGLPPSRRRARRTRTAIRASRAAASAPAGRTR